MDELGILTVFQSVIDFENRRVGEGGGNPIVCVFSSAVGTQSMCASAVHL